MNTPINQHQESGNKVAFLFGAVLNLLVSIDYVSHIDYAVRMLIGGFIWILFKFLGERLTRKTPPRRTSRPRKK